MGKIAEALSNLKPYIEYIVDVASNYDAAKLQNKLENDVYTYFSSLKPLSYEHKVVCTLPNEAQLCVGTWLRYRAGWHRFGSEITNSSDFFEYIRKYGDSLKPQVRTPIRRDFSELVDLAKQLKPFPGSEERSLTLPKGKQAHQVYIQFDGEVEVIPIRLKSVNVSLWHPRHLSVKLDGRGYESIFLDILSPSSYVVLEDIITSVYNLYEAIKTEVSAVIKHNEPIIEKMKEIAAVWMVSNNIKP